MAKDRADDVSQISDLMKNTQKKLSLETQKLLKDYDTQQSLKHENTNSTLDQVRQELAHKIEQEISDKVRVDEVQDALRRLTESF
jgi:hypothetical protein